MIFLDTFTDTDYILLEDHDVKWISIFHKAEIYNNTVRVNSSGSSLYPIYYYNIILNNSIFCCEADLTKNSFGVNEYQALLFVPFIPTRTVHYKYYCGPNSINLYKNTILIVSIPYTFNVQTYHLKFLYHKKDNAVILKLFLDDILKINYTDSVTPLDEIGRASCRERV